MPPGDEPSAFLVILRPHARWKIRGLPLVVDVAIVGHCLAQLLSVVEDDRCHFTEA